MLYIALIYADEKNTDQVPEDLMAQYGAYSQKIMASGEFKGGEALEDTPTATSIRIRDGKRQVTDGPFAETKEQLGGFYLLDCVDLDAAIEAASGIPSATYGTVEVRPIMVFDD